MIDSFTKMMTQTLTFLLKITARRGNDFPLISRKNRMGGDEISTTNNWAQLILMDCVYVLGMVASKMTN